MKSIRKVVALVFTSVTIVVCMMADSQAKAQPTAPTVIHIHHHHYYNSPSSSLISAYSPQTAWNYGFQPGLGNTVRPWKQNWGHLGFTGYLGQHGGGVDVTFQKFTGLVVDTVTPGSPASQMGLVPGDFILKINRVQVDSYKQITILFDQTEQDSDKPLVLEVWNPHTRRTSTLTAKVE